MYKVLRLSCTSGPKRCLQLITFHVQSFIQLSPNRQTNKENSNLNTRKSKKYTKKVNISTRLRSKRDFVEYFLPFILLHTLNELN